MRLKFYLEKQIKKEIDLVLNGAVKEKIRERILEEVVYV